MCSALRNRMYPKENGDTIVMATARLGHCRESVSLADTYMYE